jgi:hypothetical protein
MRFILGYAIDVISKLTDAITRAYYSEMEQIEAFYPAARRPYP